MPALVRPDLSVVTSTSLAAYIPHGRRADAGLRRAEQGIEQVRLGHVERLVSPEPFQAMMLAVGVVRVERRDPRGQRRHDHLDRQGQPADGQGGGEGQVGRAGTEQAEDGSDGEGDQEVAAVEGVADEPGVGH